MNRTRLAAVASFLLLVAVVASRQGAPGAAARPSGAPEPPRRPSPAATPQPIPPPVRDIFSYAGEDDGDAAAPVVDAAPPALSAPPSLAESPAAPPGPRLVGIVRQGATLKAAVASGGEVAILRVGEAVDGYVVVSIDEEEGVRLRDTAGAVLTLSAPER